MRLQRVDDEPAVRAAFGEFCRRHAPAEAWGEGLGGGHGGEQGYPAWARRWQATLFDGGWLVPQWPPELGGRNADPAQTLSYFAELAALGLPRTRNFQGLNIVAPALREFGTDAQRRLWLVPTLRAELLWCIGMSEPEAGSDLAGLTTRAEPTSDGFRVTGQKVWTSSAHLADLCLLYARTDPAAPRHRGISVLAVDLRSPGVQVRPFAQLTGETDFAEVFFTDVEVPAANLIGGLHEGWAVTVASLGYEREGLWLQGVAQLESHLHQLRELAGLLGRRDEPVVRRDLAAFDQQVASLRALGYRGATDATGGAARHSLLKLAAGELGKELAEYALALLGPWGPVLDEPGRGADGRWPRVLFAQFAATIAGGTSEIQRNIIAERVLGLPRAASHD